jgi:2-phosphosulfolactate phosphatase
MANTVIIDCFPESIKQYRNEYAVVAVDVIRATTTAVTAAAKGHRCFPVPSIEAALPLAARLTHPLLVGELGGNMPYGFDMTNSPAELAQRTDTLAPIILLSSSGTKLMYDAQQGAAAYTACFRNYGALGYYLGERFPHVAVIGAGTRGEFREEDQMCCAWIAEMLLDAGYIAENSFTVELVKRWRGAAPDACLPSKSVTYLRETGQLKDLAFILDHINDLNAVFRIQYDEVTMVPMGTNVLKAWPA